MVGGVHYTYYPAGFKDFYNIGLPYTHHQLPQEMDMRGGTAAKSTSELTSPWALHLRRTPAVRQAMSQAHSTYKPPAVRSRARPAARPVTQAAEVQPVARPRTARTTTTRAPVATYPLPPGYESAPASTKKWLNHVYLYHLAHPTLSRGQAIGAAIMSYRGPASDTRAEEFPYKGLMPAANV